MIFLIFITLILGLQVLHRRLLHQLFHPRFDRWVVGILVLIHLPLAFYAGMRLTGGGTSAVWLRPYARVGAYFQLLTVMDLLVWAVASLIWRWTHLWRSLAVVPPENPQRRRFLRQTSAVGVTLAAYGVMQGTMEARADPDIIRHELSFPDLPPGLDGLRLVQLSDLHSGPMVPPEQVQRWRRLAEGERPELLLITGDMVDSLPSEALAVAEAFRSLPDLRLVVVGTGPLLDTLIGSAPANVTMTGEVTDAGLRWLYANSVGLVAASYEDFGLTPLEAASFGRPTAALRWGGFLDTTVEGVTGVFFERPEPALIAEGVRALTSSPWSEEALVEHAGGFSSARFEDRMRAVVDEERRELTGQG